MKQIRFVGILLLLLATFSFSYQKPGDDNRIISYIVDPKKQDFQLYWKDDNKQIIRSIENLNNYLATKKKKLVFAMNAGMYKPDNSPCGLFIQNNKTVSKLATGSGSGNFYLKPNGVFYITSKNIAAVCTTPDFTNKNNDVKWATQSGPMLVIDGNIHTDFKKGSTNVNIRNGVGILPDNRILFALAKEEINLYDFAEYFKNQGCKNALYFDGFVSRMYLPEKNWIQTDGDFGVIIGVSTNR